MTQKTDHKSSLSPSPDGHIYMIFVDGATADTIASTVFFGSNKKVDIFLKYIFHVF